MKKNSVNHINHPFINRKALLIIFLLGIGACFTVQAQSRNVTIKTANTLKQVIDEIEKQTNYLFVYDNADINLNRQVNVKANNEKVEKVLADALRNSGITYTMKERSIMLMKQSEKAPGSLQDGDKITIRGTVKDAMNEPLIGVTVQEKETGNGIITDINGNFIIQVNSTKAVLLFSYIGYTGQEMTAEANRHMNIVLQEDVKTLDEVIVIGYTAQKKGLLTGAVSSMKVSKEMNELPLTSAGDVMIGKMAGVNVSTSNGIPGEQPSVSIRANSTFGTMPNDANAPRVQQVTYVIDGVVRGAGDFNNLSPNEIEDITILKDAASAAIYGSRAAGGVVLVTTKRGKSGKPVFNYSYSYAVDSRTKNMDLTSAVETGSWYNKINGDADPAGWRWSQEELDYYQKNVNNGWGYNQLDAVWRNPSTQSHNFSVTGGSEKVKYFAGLSYMDQKGFLEPQAYKKMNFRLNLTVELAKGLELFAGMGLTDNNTSEMPWEGAQSLYGKLLIWQPDQPVYTDGGQFVDYGWIANVGAQTKGAGGYKKNNYLKPQMVFNLKYDLPFIKGLATKASYSSNWAYTRKSEFSKNYDMAMLPKSGTHLHISDTNDANIIGWKKSNTGKDYLRKEVEWGYDYQVNLQLDYNRVFNNLHRVQGALVFERAGSSGADVFGRRETFPVYLTDQFWAASSAKTDTDGGGKEDWKDGRVSYIGQFNYSYADKYLVSFSFREDASMKFHKDQRWGFFPAASLGWIISEEKFFNKKAVDYLKLRVSAGLTGDDQVGGWQWQQSYKEGKNAYFGTTPSASKGITYGNIVNPNLTWEKSMSYNFGTDIHFLNHWNASFDYWYKHTYDILGNLEETVPTSFPLKMPDENYGKMRAQGFDIELGYRNTFNNFKFNANLTLSYGWNKILKKAYAENARYASIEEGKSSTYKKGYKVHSIIRTQAQLDAFVAQYPNYKIDGQAPALGMLVYQDLSGPDGKPDGTIDVWDETVLIKNNHPIYYGLNLGGSWKGISVDMMFNGRLKEKKSFKKLSERVEWNRGWKEWYDNEWSPENPNGWMPKRLSANTTRTYAKDTDFWWKSADFLRLKYITVSYTIPKKVMGNVFDQFKVFVTGTNLFVLSKFNYWDPEIDEGHSYPIMRTFNFGASVTF